MSQNKHTPNKQKISSKRFYVHYDGLNSYVGICNSSHSEAQKFGSAHLELFLWLRKQAIAYQDKAMECLIPDQKEIR